MASNRNVCLSWSWRAPSLIRYRRLGAISHAVKAHAVYKAMAALLALTIAGADLIHLGNIGPLS
jgi:hypothetical protein